MIKTESLSNVTMPEEVSSAILSRIGIENSDLTDYQTQRVKNFEKNLQTNTFWEIVPVFDLEEFKENRVKVSFSDIMSGGSVYYTKEEYIGHLEHLVYLLNTYDHFHVNLIEGLPESNYMVYAKEDLGVIVAKTSTPPVILAINETNMTAAFWDYLRIYSVKKLIKAQTTSKKQRNWKNT